MDKPLTEVETQKESWSKEVHDILVYDGYTPSFNSEAEIDAYYEFLKRAKLKIVQLISQALLSDRARLVEQVNQQMVPLLYDKTYTSDYRQGYEDAIVKVESIIKESR